MSLINISGLTFSYNGSYDNIFENVSFKLDTDWRLGFVGRNGRGKTTFLQLLLGKFKYIGKISASVDFEYFPYCVSNTQDYTIDIIREICPDIQDWEIIREANALQIETEALYRPYDTLSCGEQTKIMLAGMFLRKNAFLLIDEPTNHLDSDGRKLLAEYLSRKKGFILVSHDRHFLDSCTDHTLSINKNNIEIEKGSFSSWLYNKELRDSFELNKNEKLKKEIKHLQEAAKRTADWSEKAEKRKIGFDPTKVEKSMGRRANEGAKAKKMMSRSSAITERLRNTADEKSNLLKNVEETAELKLSPLEFHSNRLLQLDKIALFYDNKMVCSNVSFTVQNGERIAICGKNGCGKSSILKLICGENINYTGEIIKSNQLKISYVPQNTNHLKGTLQEYAQLLGIELSLFLAILRKLGFSRQQFEKRIEAFSGGQKKKVLIAGSLCEKAHLYVWDEPLNFIDVISRIQIEKLLLNYRPSLIFVEHDEAFKNNTATKIIEIK